MKSKASFGGTNATRTAENPSRLNPAGGLRPAWTEPPPFAFCSTHAKRSQIQNRTFHLLFKADILTCYQQPDTALKYRYDVSHNNRRKRSGTQFVQRAQFEVKWAPVNWLLRVFSY
jgi:hypothetical protein